MLKLINLSLRRGSRLLFENVNFAVYPQQKIGVTGANGTGKSSLFALLLGELHADSGDYQLPSQWVIAHVAQETPAVSQPAIEYVLDGDQQLRAIEKNLLAAQHCNDADKIARLHGQLECIDGYTALSRAAILMHGLGFSSEQTSMPVAAFSGGWRMRLNLAQALMCRSDLLLLDEPTNHLDLDAVLWVEEWLNNYKGTLLLISHDRDFLDNVTTHIAYIEQQHMTLYTGNYTEFERRRAEQLANQQASYEKQQREIAHVTQFITRFRAKATKARQAQSRLKALSRMALITSAHVDSPFNFTFQKANKIPNPLLRLEDVTLAYNQAIIVHGINISLVPGDRIGVLGPNGAGKSTLIKLFAQSLSPHKGSMDMSSELKIGYFAQHQLEQLDPGASPLLHLQRLDPNAEEQKLRNFLGGFAFFGDAAMEPIAPLSGGEKARMVLALIVYQKPNLLLLDEPTNHLDLDMRHALTVALQDYEGALIVVSHDRHLLRTVADEFWLIADGTVSPFDGDIDDYRVWLNSRKRESKTVYEKIEASVSKKQQRQQSADKRKQLQPLRKQAQQLEKQLEKLSLQKKNIEAILADSTIYEDDNKERLKVLLLEQANLEQLLDDTENKWLDISEKIEECQ
ncbi:MAG: ATP-binding cassette domain-containing protein [Gammaproteobacteria bacterium]|nr:ATP-binding cassette domain-containing protein [Gammaproteobacteria bacterium]